MKKLFLLITIAVLLVNCGGSDKNAKISNDFITAMANEDAEGLKKLFPESNQPLSFYSDFINEIKNKFNQHHLKGWKKMEVKGYIITRKGIDIIVTDANGTYFIFHELRFIDKNKTSYRIGNDDLHVFDSKDDIIKRGGKAEQIHWF